MFVYWIMGLNQNSLEAATTVVDRKALRGFAIGFPLVLKGVSKCLLVFPGLDLQKIPQAKGGKPRQNLQRSPENLLQALSVSHSMQAKRDLDKTYKNLWTTYCKPLQSHCRSISTKPTKTCGEPIASPCKAFRSASANHPGPNYKNIWETYCKPLQGLSVGHCKSTSTKPTKKNNGTPALKL